jgi:hypothetical protein
MDRQKKLQVITNIFFFMPDIRGGIENGLTYYIHDLYRHSRLIRTISNDSRLVPSNAKICMRYTS